MRLKAHLFAALSSAQVNARTVRHLSFSGPVRFFRCSITEVSIRTAASCVLLAVMLQSGYLRVPAAEPVPQAQAAKPKLVPRPVPGLSTSSQRTNSAPSKPAVSANASGSAVGTAPDQARILAIYRRGTFPVQAAAPAAPDTVPTVQNPTLPDLPAAAHKGTVRIMSKEEAGKLLAKPQPPP